MMDTTDKDNNLFMASTGNAVLFTTTALPSPVKLSLPDENSQSEQLGTPILITRPKSYIIKENTTVVNGIIDSDIPEMVICNGEALDLQANRSEACMMRVKQDWYRAISLLKEDDIMLKIRDLALRGELDSHPLRNIAWRLFLGVLPTSIEEWVDTVNTQREKYNTEKNKVDIDPHKLADKSHPLSNESNSAWNQYFLDQDLWQIVDQDVSRTWPEERIFKDEKIRNLMRRVLFTHAKAQSKFEYRQGMHELLANIIYMMCTEHEKCPISEQLPEYIRHVLDPAYLEEDSYTLFSELMEYCDVWYDGGHEEAVLKARTNIRIETPFEKEGVVLGLTALSKKLNKIQGTLLKKHDSELAEYMDSLDLSPQVYGIRWVRLLFGREFVLRDLLHLWDVLFAQGTSLDLIDYIAIAILIAMRNSILEHDQGDCLLRLMKYPQEFPVRDIINHALHLKQPNWAYTPSFSNPLSVEKPLMMSSPPRDSIFVNREEHLHSNSAEDLTKWNELKVGNTNWKTKSLRSNTSGVNQSLSFPNSIKNKINTIPARSRTSKSFQTQLSNPGSSPKKQSEASHTSHSTVPNLSAIKPENVRDQVLRLEKEVELLHVKSDYCIGKLTAYVDHLQDLMYDCKFATKEKEDSAFLAVAGIKQIRDILKGQLELGDSSFGLDASMYHYIRDSNPDLVGGDITPEDNSSAVPETDREEIKKFLKDKELEDNSVDLFVNTSPPAAGAEMVELRHSNDPLLEPSLTNSLFSPNHPLECSD